MREIIELLRKSKRLTRLRERVAETRHPSSEIFVDGVVRGAYAPLFAALAGDFPRPMIIVTPTPKIAEQLYSDLQALLGSSARLQHFAAHSGFGAAELMVLKERLSAVNALRTSNRAIVITSVAAACRPTIPSTQWDECYTKLHPGCEGFTLNQLTERLLAGGYERHRAVELLGQFSVRGGIMDIFPPTDDTPTRIEFVGDTIESLRAFDVETQRSTQKRDDCTIIPAREFIIPPDSADIVAKTLEIETRVMDDGTRIRKEQTRLLRDQVERDIERLRDANYFEGYEWYLPFSSKPMSFLPDHLPTDALVSWVEPTELEFEHDVLAADWEKFDESLVATGDLLAPPRPPLMMWDDFATRCDEFPLLRLTARVDAGTATVETHHVEAFDGHTGRLTGRLAQWLDEGRTVAVATRYPERVVEMLISDEREGPPLIAVRADRNTSLMPKRVTVFGKTLHSGFAVADANLIVVSDAELFGTTFVKRRRRRFKASTPINHYTELREGDYIVHIAHGIGIFQGVVRQKVLEAEADYLKIEYADGDNLYIPVHQIDRVQRYLTTDGGEPALAALKGVRWARAKARAKKKAEDIAGELVELYAQREATEGHAFPEDEPWQREMEEAFPFDETEDQETAIAEMKKDMQQPKPMDRLVCGDVGFGKTEVGLRAAFKAVLDGKQAALLCPTTVLAQQHAQTFTARLAPFPVRVEMLSRFRSPKQRKDVIEKLKVGSVDIVIGTHRILSDDIQFKNLGLLIIDEEQRFGVKQKERLKQLRTGVDVLTLTATPIPRTLNMALGNLREMSVIHDPPEGRRAVRTYLSPYDEDLMRYALERELGRGGQVYYVHNRVEGIEHVAGKVAKVCPNARIAVGHGQMTESALERVMLDFYSGETDVLVCTTIIENGLDVANANTLIVEHCERFGLAQLYQLRGRVGRSDRQAYTYLFHAQPKRLSERARLRLDAMREFSDLGSGFSLALRDLEIRGAGNLLGAEQHGTLSDVGFDLYMKMLADSVATLKGDAPPPKVELPQADLPIKAFISDQYIEDYGHRLHIYQRMAAVSSSEELDDIERELEDRFGIMPAEAAHLLSVLRIRLAAHRARIAYISHDTSFVVIKFFGAQSLNDLAFARLYGALRKQHSENTLEAVRLFSDRAHIEHDQMSTATLLQMLEDLLVHLADDPSTSSKNIPGSSTI